MWVYGLDWAGPGQRQVADACECGNEPSGSVKCGEFLDQLQTSWLLKKDSAPWSKVSIVQFKPIILFERLYSLLMQIIVCNEAFPPSLTYPKTCTVPANGFSHLNFSSYRNSSKIFSSVFLVKLITALRAFPSFLYRNQSLLTLQRGVTGTARMLHALTHSSISRQVREQM